MKNLLIKFLEFLPLSTFLILQRLLDDRWREIFLLAAGLSIFVLVFFYLIKYTLNRLTLGINIYLIFGCLVNLAGLPELNEFVQSIRSIGMVLSIICVAIVTMIFTKCSFIALESSNKKEVNNRSIYLLTATILCGIFMILGNYIFNLNLFFIEILPFVMLFTFQGVLRGIKIK